MNNALDPATRELVGIAAAVAGHCEPCFVHHYREALKLGITYQAVDAAVELAKAVRQGGDTHMDEFVARRLFSIAMHQDTGAATEPAR